MSHEKDQMEELEQLFQQARAHAPEPGPDFLARVLSDAEAMQPAPATPMQRVQGAQGARGKRSALREFFAGLGDAIGGWPAFAGLGVAAVTGLYIGISPPQSLIAPFGAAFGGDGAALSESLDFGEGFDFTQFEG